MDNNYNFYQPSDGQLNMSQNGSLNSSGDFSGLGNVTDLQNLTPQQLYQLQLINQQQIQQLSVQLAQAQLSGVPPATNYQLQSPVSPVGHVTFNNDLPGSPRGTANMAQTLPMTSAMSPHVIGQVPVNSSINLSINGHLPTMQQNKSHTYNEMAYPNASGEINTRLHDPIHVQVPNLTGQLANIGTRNVVAPDSLNLQHMNKPRDTSYSSSSYSSSPTSTPQDSPAMPKKPPTEDVFNGPTFMSRPRQRVLSPPPAKPPSDRGSTSSASISGSPVSSGYPAISPDGNWSDTSGPMSPDGTQRKGVNGTAQIKNTHLQMQTKYPQDKCYSCRKRVYPMEKLGPVKGVVYHKGCFRCNGCKTTLNLKNFFHSQIDNYDVSVYCKSHQPLSSEKAPKLGSDSFEIKSALSTPKKGGVTSESERVPIHKYSYDATCQAIEHARKAPVAELQSGVKARNNAWSKSKREHYSAAPVDIVKHDEPAEEYNTDEYNRFQVESQPDYT